MDSGLYIAIFHLAEPLTASIGKFGSFSFVPGYYFYVGSAIRNMSARLKRHASHDKPLRWHIDYLSIRAKMVGAVTFEDFDISECEIAQELALLYQRILPRFGASDCKCEGHLFYSESI